MANLPGHKPENIRLFIKGGLEVELLNYGATLKSIRVPVDGELIDVLLQYPDDEAYLHDKVYLGATVGRYAGRIDSGVASLQGEEVRLLRNEADTGHCLHGGPEGFSHKFWSVAEQSRESVSFDCVSEDGDQGFPGCLTTRVCYRLIGPMKLQIEYTAETDQDTFVNLSNHAYFNLNRTDGEIENHELWINSDRFTPLGANSLPTGDVIQVADSVFDFRNRARLGERLKTADPQLTLAGGYDHFFLLNDAGQQSNLAATVYSPESGINMRLFTDQPGVQFYSGNWLDQPFLRHAGLCLEFQDVPNEPNMEGFPSTVLKPGETYRRVITLEFEC